MKARTFPLVAAFAALFSVARADTILLSDNFSGPSLNTSLWSTILPYGGSSVTQAGGSVTTTGRGILATNDGFTGPYMVNGTFTMLNDLEHFNVVLRSNMSSTNSFEERTGLIVTFVNDGNGISIQEYTNPMANWRQIASTGENGFNLTTGDTYFFSILDTGDNISLAVNGVNLLSVATTYGTGDRVGFYSREFGSTATAIDAVNIVHVPETGVTALFLGMGLAGMLMVGRRKTALA